MAQEQNHSLPPQSANLLGRAIKYVNDAFDYAKKANRSADSYTPRQRRGGFNQTQVSPSSHPDYENSLREAERQTALNNTNNQPPIGSGGGSSYPISLFDTSLERMAFNRDQNQNTEKTSSTDDSIRSALMSTWVYSDVKIIADRVATEEAWPIVRRFDPDLSFKEYEAWPSHPLTNLLRHPNPLMTGSYMMKYTAWWRCLLGNAYIFISTDDPGEGIPLELWPLPANMVRPMPQSLRPGIGRFKDRAVIDYEYKLSADSVPLIMAGENVIHLRTPNPLDWWQGLSPLSAAMLDIKLDYSQEKWLHDFFAKDNAVPTAIISLPKEMRKDDYDYAREQIKAQFMEGRKSMITRAGDIDVELIRQTLDELQIVSAREFNKKSIDRIMGVPEGLSSGEAAGDALLSSEISFARNTIQPFIHDMASDITHNIGPYYSDNFVLVAPNIIPQDQALSVQEFAQYKSVLTYAENRNKLGLPELPPLPQELNDKVGGVDLLREVPLGIVDIILAMQQAGQAADSQLQLAAAASASASNGPGSGSNQVRAGGPKAATSNNDQKQANRGLPASQRSPKSGDSATTARVGGSAGSQSFTQQAARHSTRTATDLDLDGLGGLGLEDLDLDLDLEDTATEYENENENENEGGDATNAKTLATQEMAQMVDPSPDPLPPTTTTILSSPLTATSTSIITADLPALALTDAAPGRLSGVIEVEAAGGEGWADPVTKAATLAELSRWRRVARKSLKAGGQPREFTSAVLTQPQISYMANLLDQQGADALSIENLPAPASLG